VDRRARRPRHEQPDFAKGAATFTGSVSLRLEGLPVGEVVQVRMSEYDAVGALKQDHPIREVTGTPGGTFAVGVWRLAGPCGCGC
jgi:hypothetical protein